MPPIILRFLLQMYTGSKSCIFCNGLFSNMFAASNGVKQGGILSPLLFSVYFDVLINRLTQSGYGCYIGLVFLAVFVYADDVVLLAPTATAMRHFLSICDILLHILMSFLMLKRPNVYSLVQLVNRVVPYPHFMLAIPLLSILIVGPICDISFLIM